MVGALSARADALHLRGNAAYRILSLPRWRNGPHGRSRARAATGRSPRNHATLGSVHVRTETGEAGSRSAAGGRVPARPPGCPELLAGLAAAVASRLRRAADADPLIPGAVNNDSRMRRTGCANRHGGRRPAIHDCSAPNQEKSWMPTFVGMTRTAPSVCQSFGRLVLCVAPATPTLMAGPPVKCQSSASQVPRGRLRPAIHDFPVRTWKKPRMP